MIKEITHKWHKQVMRQRQRMGIPHKATTCEKVGLVADEGQFAIYTIDGSRFRILLDYPYSPIFKKLLLMAEAEFGFTGYDPLRVPCEAFVIEHIDSLFRKNASKEWRKH
ncbi:hypothetical protein AMTRI_Chr02g214270 [Amborella trichopoda]